MSLIDIFVIVFFIAFLALVGLYRSKKEVSESSYLVANRNISLFSLIATLVMTEFNSATLIAFSSLGFIMGKKAFLFPLIFLIGLLFYAAIAAKKWKDFNGISVAHFFTKKYGKNFGKIASFLLILSMIGFTSSYIKSLTVLFAEIFPHLNYWVLRLRVSFYNAFNVSKRRSGVYYSNGCFKLYIDFNNISSDFVFCFKIKLFRQSKY